MIFFKCNVILTVFIIIQHVYSNPTCEDDLKKTGFIDSHSLVNYGVAYIIYENDCNNVVLKNKSESIFSNYAYDYCEYLKAKASTISLISPHEFCAKQPPACMVKLNSLGFTQKLGIHALAHLIVNVDYMNLKTFALNYKDYLWSMVGEKSIYAKVMKSPVSWCKAQKSNNPPQKNTTNSCKLEIEMAGFNMSTGFKNYGVVYISLRNNCDLLASNKNIKSLSYAKLYCEYLKIASNNVPLHSPTFWCNSEPACLEDLFVNNVTHARGIDSYVYLIMNAKENLRQSTNFYKDYLEFMVYNKCSLSTMKLPEAWCTINGYK